MLPKTKRLTVAQFARVFATGTRIHTSYLTVVYVRAASFQASVVVGKKVAKRAVERNAIRRRLYGVLAECRHDTLPYQCLVLTKPALNTLTKAEQRHALCEAMASAPPVV